MLKYKFAAVALLALSFICEPSVADARIYFYSNYWNSWMPQSRWLMRPNTLQEKPNNNANANIDLDAYFDKDLVRSENKKNNSKLSKNDGLDDMRKKQSDMQKELEKQRKAMEDSFSKITTPETSKTEAPKTQELPPQKELPTFEVTPQRIQQMPDMPKLEQQQLPELQPLPQMNQLQQPQLPKQEEQRQTQAEPKQDRAPATLDISEDKKVATVETKEESKFGQKNYIIVGVALIFLGVGAMFAMSR